VARRGNRRLAEFAKEAHGERVPRYIPGEEEGPILSRLGFVIASIALFLVVSATAVWFGSQRIEESLENQALRALRASGYTGVRVEAEGRVLTALGVVPEAGAGALVGELLREEVPGARSVEVTVEVADAGDETAVIPADPLEIRWGDGQVSVIGTVSTEEVRNLVISRLAVEFPDAVDAEALLVVPGVPDEDAWMSRVLQSLLVVAAEVDSGSVVVNSEADVVTVSAVMPDRQTRADARRKVEETLAAAPLDFVNGLTLEDAPPPPPRTEVVELQEDLDTLLFGKVVEFELASDTLTSAGEALLDDVLAALRTVPDVAVEIAGHADASGTPEFNLDLSMRRAEAVLAYLVANGEESSRFQIVGYGETQPVADNNTEEGRARNRRIEFIALED